VSFDQREADAAALVQHLVSYAMDLGLRNAGTSYLLMSVEQLTLDLCAYDEMFEKIEPSKLQPYVAVWRETKIAEADAQTAVGTTQQLDNVD